MSGNFEISKSHFNRPRRSSRMRNLGSRRTISRQSPALNSRISGQCFDSNCTNGLCFNGTQANTYGQCQHVRAAIPGVGARQRLGCVQHPSRYRTASQDSELEGSQGGGVTSLSFCVLCAWTLNNLTRPSCMARLHFSATTPRSIGLRRWDLEPPQCAQCRSVHLQEGSMMKHRLGLLAGLLSSAAGAVNTSADYRAYRPY